MTKEARWLDKELVARIAGRAYWLYEARGRRDGFDVQDWLQAEREISGSEEILEQVFLEWSTKHKVAKAPY
jgi:Protein of unknown function (DUF2934)